MGYVAYDIESIKYDVTYRHDLLFNYLGNISSDEPQRICKHVRGILEDLCSEMKSGNVTVEMLLHLKMKWNTHIVRMMSTLSVDQNKFVDDMRFANKKVHTFEIFLILLKEFASSIPKGMLIFIVVYYLCISFCCFYRLT